MENFVLFHHHIFKNAGSTIDWILERNFGAQFGRLETKSSSGIVTPEVFLKHIGKHKKLKAISSHHFHGQEYKSDTRIFFDIIFLRHPLDRLRSIYDFCHANNSLQDSVANAAQKMSLGEFLDHLVQHQPHQVNDVQVNILSRHGVYRRPPYRFDLNVARSRLRNISVPGSLDKFDESLVAAEFFLAPAFGELDLSYIKRNTSSGRGASLEDRLDELHQECGSKLYQHLLTMNELDLKLLEYVDREIEGRIRYVPDMDERLAKFRDRCSRLSVHIH